MLLMRKLMVPTLIMLWAVTYFLEINQNVTSDQLLIRPVFYLLILLYVINTVGDIRSLKNEKNEANQKNSKMYKFILVTLGYLVLLETVGFIIVTLLFLTICLVLFDVKEKMYLILFPVALTGILYAIFKLGLGVPLPQGLLPF